MGFDCCLVTEREVVIPLKKITFEAEVLNAFCNIKSCFYYSNNTDSPVDAVFTFPLSDVAVYWCEAQIGQRTIRAECHEKEKAQRDYDSAVAKGHRAFMTNQSDICEDIFRMNVGNIGIGEQIVISLKYATLIDAEDILDEGRFSHSRLVLTLPTLFNPRYMPKDFCNIGQDFLNASSGSTEMGPFFEFSARVQMPSEILEIVSDRDSYNVFYDDESRCSAKVKLGDIFVNDHDLQMVIKLKERLASMAAIEAGDRNSENNDFLSRTCLMAQFWPDLLAKSAENEAGNEFIFLVDRSGSMRGFNIEWAKFAIQLFLKSLPPGCRFQIFCFGSTCHSISDGPQDYSTESIKQAIDSVKKFEADMGGTEMFGALEQVFSIPFKDASWRRTVIMLTDGAVYDGNRIVGLVGMNAKRSRVFTIGLGDGVSTTLLEGMATAGNGQAAFARNENQLNSAVTRILSTVKQPYATNVKLEYKIEVKTGDGSIVPQNIVTIPQNMTAIYQNRHVTAFALIPCDNVAWLKGEVVLSYERMGEKESIVLDIKSALPTVSLKSSVEHRSLHRLAGKAYIKEMLQSYYETYVNRVDANTGNELKQKILSVSLSCNVMSMFTTLVGVDSELPDKTGKRGKVVTTSSPGGLGYDQAKCSTRTKSSNLFSKSFQRIFSKSIQRSVDEVDCFLSSSSGYVQADCSTRTRSSNLFSKSFQRNSDEDEDDGEDMPTSKKDNFNKMVDLMVLDGYWNLDHQLAATVEIGLDELKKAKLSILVSDQLWATAIAVAYIEKKLSHRKSECFVLIEKSKKWMASAIAVMNSIEGRQTSVDWLIQKAKEVIV